MKPTSKTWYQRLSLPIYVLIAAGLLLIAVVYFGLPHVGWYYKMEATERVKFWTEFGVSFGTIVLAIVALATLYEQRTALRKENAILRQSRIPMVCLNPSFPNEESPFVKTKNDIVRLAVFNDGDGPALNVYLSFRLSVRYHRLVGVVGQPYTETISEQKALASSYLAPKTASIVEYPQAIPDMVNHQPSIKLESMEIRYDDQFGTPFVTTYRDFMGNPKEFRSGPEGFAHQP